MRWEGERPATGAGLPGGARRVRRKTAKPPLGRFGPTATIVPAAVIVWVGARATADLVVWALGCERVPLAQVVGGFAWAGPGIFLISVALLLFARVRRDGPRPGLRGAAVNVAGALALGALVVALRLGIEVPLAVAETGLLRFVPYPRCA